MNRPAVCDGESMDFPWLCSRKRRHAYERSEKFQAPIWDWTGSWVIAGFLAQLLPNQGLIVRRSSMDIHKNLPFSAGQQTEAVWNIKAIRKTNAVVFCLNYRKVTRHAKGSVRVAKKLEYWGVCIVCSQLGAALDKLVWLDRARNLTIKLCSVIDIL